MTNTKKVSVIPVGYRMEIHTWENDIDNHDMVILVGLSIGVTKFYAALCKLHDANSEYGNLYDPETGDIEAHRKIIHETVLECLQFLTHNDVVHLFGHFRDFDNSYVVWHNVMDILELLKLSRGEYYTRVFDRATIEYVPTEIRLEDVTSDFI